MPDRPPPRSLEDDPRFLARLHDLERGLGPPEGRHHGEPSPRARDIPGQWADRAPAHEPEHDGIGFLTDAIFEGHETVPPPARLPRARRPLLDLFPAAPAERREPRAPSLDAAAASSPAPPVVERSDTRAPLVAAPPPPSETYPRFFYPAASHTRVLNRLLERVHASEGLVVLTAPHGFGKTTVCRAAARNLDRRTLQALVLEPPQSIEQLLQIVLVDFGVVSRGDLAGAPQVKREALMATLASFVKSLAPLQANALIVIDDAHTIPEAVLTELRDVVAAVDSRLLQIVVAGEPELESMVERAGLRATGGDRGVVLELQPLAADEIEPYVWHRLQVVDNRARVDFSPGAFARLYQLSRGVPRDINLLCERALIQGAAGSASVIDSALVDRAAADVGRAIPGAAPPAMARRMVLLLVLMALMLVGAAAAAWVFRDAANRAFSQWLHVPPAPAGNLPGRPPI